MQAFLYEAFNFIVILLSIVIFPDLNYNPYLVSDIYWISFVGFDFFLLFIFLKANSFFF